jgi:putative hydrolase of the HAD superfamily
MNTTSSRALVLDFGQVLTLDQDGSAWDQLLGGLGIPRSVFMAANGRFRLPFDGGLIDAAGYWSQVLAACAADCPDSALAQTSPGDWTGLYLEALIETDYRAWCRPRKAMHEVVIRALGAGVPMAILSNMPTGIGDRFVGDWDWLAGISHRVFSGDIQLVKPEPGIYRWLEAKTGWRGADMLFVDDRLENIETARSLGWKTHHFQDESAAIKAVADWCGLD